MMKRHTTINPIRLFHAADALLAAREQGAGDHSGSVSMYLTNSEHVTVDGLDLFTEAELMEAMDMLIRMGYVSTTTRARR